MPFSTFAELRSIYRDDARQAYMDFVERRPREQICAFALATDEEVMGASPCGDTIERRNQRLARRPPRNAAEQKYHAWSFGWNTGEWDDIYTAEQPSAKPSRVEPKEMFEGMLAFRHQWLESGGGENAFRRNALRTMVDALADLDKEGLFGNGSKRKEMTLFVEITDSEEGEILKMVSANLLNPPSSARRMTRDMPATGRLLVLGMRLFFWFRRGALVARRSAS